MARTKKQILDDAGRKAGQLIFEKDLGDMTPSEMWDASQKIKKHNAKKAKTAKRSKAAKAATDKVSEQFNGTFPKKRPDYVKVGKMK